jgi:tetratricopeptide (TPR) repeat protein
MPNAQRGAILGVVGLLLAFLGFMVGRATAPSAVPTVPTERTTPAASAVVSASAPLSSRLAEPHEIKLIDDAMAAQTSGDFLTAEKLLQQLMQQAPDIAGNQTALVLLQMQKGDFVGADIYIKRGLDAGEDAGRLYGLRGIIEMRLSHPRKAAEAFEMATRSEPHQFKGYFLWAEFLRRLGKNQQALERFDQAIARVHEQADEEVMQFKRRLTLIAAGRGKELEPEIEQQLSMNPPPGDWLLLAMANAAQKYDFKSAAKYLERATQTMNPDALVDRLRDFYLYQWCYEKELEPYFQPLQKRLSTARRAEPATTEAKPGEDLPAAGTQLSPPAPTKR